MSEPMIKNNVCFLTYKVAGQVYSSAWEEPGSRK